MKLSLKVSVFNIFFGTIILLIWIKLLFSYLAVRVHYFQRDLKSNEEVFNFLSLPADFSSKIEYVLFPFLLGFVLRYSKHFKASKGLIFISIIMFVLNIITSLKNEVATIDSLRFSLKIFTPIYFFCALVIYHNKTKKTLKKILLNTVFLCVFLTFIGLVFFNPSINRLQNYLPIYFDSIHTQSYLLVSAFMGLAYIIYRKGNKLNLIIFLVLTFLFLYLGYNIRTAVIMYLIFIITMLFLVSNIFKILFVKVLIFLPLFIFLFFLINSEVDFTEISSGRTDMYGDKITQLSNFSFLDWVFGQGAGSDLIKTDIWWWEKKGAHSDVITFLVENGALYLFWFIIVYYQLIKLSKRNNIIFLSLLFASLFSSFISNGITVRPLANYIFYLSLAYIYIDLSKKSKFATS